MLLPPLCTQANYVDLAKQAGLSVSGGPKDISADVKATWYVRSNPRCFFLDGADIEPKSRDISWSLVQNPSLWAFAFSQGRDGIAFLQSFRAMRRGFANGNFRYAVVAFQK